MVLDDYSEGSCCRATGQANTIELGKGKWTFILYPSTYSYQIGLF